MPTTAFPLPAPDLSVFGGSGPGLSRKRLHKLARARVLHVTVMILDFLHLGRFPTDEEIGRKPNALQLSVFARLRTSLAVCGTVRDPFPLVPGRSGPQLAASLMQLEGFVSSCADFKDSYVRAIQPELYHEDPSLLPLEDYPQLVPYRDLDASRLRIAGKGHWPMEKYLHDALWLPFVEPAFLRHGLSVSGASVPSFVREKRDEYLKLAKVWDVNGLLALCDSPYEPGDFCKVFQVFKSEVHDRQIGDRRIINCKEFHVDGPSRNLPTGQMLTQLKVKRFQEQLLGSVTDRRDFYHQCEVSPERFKTNMVPFSYDRAELEGTAALAEFERIEAEKRLARKAGRCEAGDKFGRMRDSPKADGLLYPCFASLFQGDHLGVEFALSAHESLLIEENLLAPESRLLGHVAVPFGPEWTGLIIDDFFAVGAHPIKAQKCDSFAFKALARARLAYEKHELEGSKEKDVEAMDFFKAAGAEVDSRVSTVRNGLCLVSAPFAKRFALSALSLRAASLPSITPRLAARLAGNWVSVVLYRRCISAVVDEFFALGAGLEKEESPALVPLKRSAAQELVLLSALAPLMSSNIAAEFTNTLFASDASNEKGAVVSAEIRPEVSAALWQATEKRGRYVTLERPVRATLKGLVSELELEEETVESLEVSECHASDVFRPPLLKFDFVEICGGAGVVSQAASSLGMVVAPVLDLSESPHYDLRGLRFLEWVIHMIESGRFASFLVEPPCTSFSVAAHPSVRSYEEPLGFCRTEKKTLHGNTLAFRSFVLLKVGRRKMRPCGLEQPRRSKMAWLSFWISLRELGFFDSIIASCQFGSPHKKEFQFLLFLLDRLDVRCPGGHEHLKVEGKWTKGSAVYVPGLALHVAKGFHRALLKIRRAENDEVRCNGLESIVVNDVMSSADWQVEKSWSWKRKSHINVLELHSSVSALGLAGLREPDSRPCLAVDSQVSKGALAKGRSSAFSLQPGLKRSCAVQLAFGLFPVWTFSPTRLNVSDDPTRSRQLRSPCKHSVVAAWDRDLLSEVHSIGLKRFAANWCRLTILVLQVTSVSADFASGVGIPELPWTSIGFWPLPFRFCGLLILASSLSILLCGLLWTVLVTVSTSAATDRWNCHASKQPSRSFAFRPRRFARFCLGLLLFLGSKTGRPLIIFGLASGAAQFGGAAAMVPENPAEEKRAAMRASLQLPADRVVRNETRKRRLQLITYFRTWLWSHHQVSLRGLLNQKPIDAEVLSFWLVQYGREMFGAGKSYNKFSETINAIAMLKPLIKRSPTPAWDLCFAWLADEPHSHHPALPASILLAMLSVALCWGWAYEAAVLSLTWAGILRIGEVLQARRSDLILPSDAAPGQTFVLLQIADPKTRGRSARHQSARVDQPDIIRLLTAVYEKADSNDLLWPLSASTLRKRFSSLLTALGITGTNGRGLQFDLASLRPGGATHLLNMSENSELVRRRGRWLSHRVMEIYLQEIQVATCLNRIPQNQREKILLYARCFEGVLDQVVTFLNYGVPPVVWFSLLKGQRVEEPESFGRDGTERHSSCDFNCECKDHMPT